MSRQLYLRKKEEKNGNFLHHQIVDDVKNTNFFFPLENNLHIILQLEIRKLF